MKPYINQYKYYALIALSLAFLYFALRLPNLTLQPIFADEAIYIRWAQVMRAEPSLRFLPLQDGKTPLFMWTMIPFFKVFEDPLLAGRILSVVSGYGTFLGIGFLALQVFNKRVALWSLFLAAIVPFLVFFDRLALVDSMLAAFSIWTLNIAILLVRKMRTDLAMVLGYLLGGAVLTKTPGFFNILVLPITILFASWTRENRERNLLKLFGLWAIVFLVTFFVYNILKLGPGVQNLNSRNQDYVRSPMDVLARPWDPFLPHTYDLLDWLPKLLTEPILLLVVLGIVISLWRKSWPAIAIVIWSLVPMTILMAFLQTFTARYILFSIPPLIVLAGFAADWLATVFQSKRYNYLVCSVIVILLILPMVLNFNFKLLFNPLQAPLPEDERRGYLEDWTAGYGFKEIARYLEDQSKKELVVVGTEGYFGTLPDGLQIYLDKNRQVIVKGSHATVSADLRSTAKEHPTYFVANKSRYPTQDRDMVLIKEYPKAKGKDFPQDSILFYQVFP